VPIEKLVEAFLFRDESQTLIVFEAQGEHETGVAKARVASGVFLAFHIEGLKKIDREPGPQTVAQAEHIEHALIFVGGLGIGEFLKAHSFAFQHGEAHTHWQGQRRRGLHGGAWTFRPRHADRGNAMVGVGRQSPQQQACSGGTACQSHRGSRLRR
jgi:hypothetical protein